MNTCYYYQDLLPRPVHGVITLRFNPVGVSNLLVYSMIALDKLPGPSLNLGPGPVWLHRFNLVHFQGYSIRLVGFYANDPPGFHPGFDRVLGKPPTRAQGTHPPPFGL